MKPLIGITADRLREGNKDGLWNTIDYFTAVQHAGGIPMLLPYIDTAADAGAILERLDGILFSGGSDVDPVYFGEEPIEKLGGIDPERDTTELLLAEAALQASLPILGICRGHQLLAVAAGGNMWQDIPSQVAGALKHSQTKAPKWYASHSITVTPGTRLAHLLGGMTRVNSRHHQAVRQVPPGWVESAVAADFVNEAMELPGTRFVLSVQWHPENCVGRPYNFDRIFAEFVAAAGAR